MMVQSVAVNLHLVTFTPLGNVIKIGAPTCLTIPTFEQNSYSLLYKKKVLHFLHYLVM